MPRPRARFVEAHGRACRNIDCRRPLYSRESRRRKSGLCGSCHRKAKIAARKAAQKPTPA